MKFLTTQISCQAVGNSIAQYLKQDGQHPLTGQRAANFRLLANQ